MKMMRRVKSLNLYEFLSSYDLTIKSSDYFKDVLNFEVDAKMPQRKLVDLGKVIGRIISMEFTINLGEQGFNRDLVQNAIETLQDEVNSIMTLFKNGGNATVIEDYENESSWFNLQSLHAH
jgi:hypothetical protein